ncbi:transcriptional regulator, Sir2 family [Bulleidia extructa W1219]|uniref:protein acetyllysine N-acetyltransferase n=1 Tax=Bulleidia extructa W1219 TaxID=679192 RepID=D2MNH3_9FIRM|nr:transcriptional regulator, Sir2 family [Bulleidia extructa W1219]
MRMKQAIEKFYEIIQQGHKIVFFTGAGVSTASGIPDFRSQDGLYHQKYTDPPEKILSHSYFMEHTAEFFEFYRDKMLYLNVRDSYVHQFIAQLEKEGKSVNVITQNIDGLHQKAGSGHVLELHGSVLRNYCMNCHQARSAQFIKESVGIPKCSICGGIIKPDVVLYEEGLDEKILYQAIRVLDEADVCVIMGTSLVVYPAAGLLRYFHGDTLVLINREITPYDDQADLVLHMDFKEIFQK